MPEIKNTFTGGKMNKDLDERLVPKGEYRDALNVQVRTTDGAAMGTVQNLKGNTGMQKIYNTLGVMGDSSQAVGCITDEKSDNIYFMIAAPDATNVGIKSATITGETKYIDYIIEHNALTEVQMPVIVDHYATIDLTSNGFVFTDTMNSNGWVLLRVSDSTFAGMRKGMRLEMWDQDGSPIVDGKIVELYPVEDSQIIQYNY